MNLVVSIKKLLSQISLVRRSYFKIKFRKIHGYPLNLHQPRSLSQKIQWICHNCDLTPLATFTDKATVREFVRDQIGGNYLIPLIGIYEKFDDIDFNALPQQFVMKATHGSNWNVLVQNKLQIDWCKIREQFTLWLKECYYQRSWEANYKDIRGRIIIEEFLEDPDGDLRDFKFYCCQGEPLGAHVDINRFGNHQYRIYDTHWNEFEKNNPAKGIDIPQITKPEKLDEMLDICRKLSRGFPYVRVDLYYTAGKIFFGELTFTPGNGLVPFDPVASDFYFGEPFDIKPFRKIQYYVPHWTPERLES